MELYRHDVIRRLETFRMAKFYYPELSMIKKVSFVFSLEKKDLHNFWAANDMLNDNAEHKEAGIDDLLCWDSGPSFLTCISLDDSILTH